MSEVFNTPERFAGAGYAGVVVFNAFRSDPLAVLAYLRAPIDIRRAFMHRLRIDVNAQVYLLAEKIVGFERSCR